MRGVPMGAHATSRTGKAVHRPWDGTIDDTHIYDRALTPPKKSKPSPPGREGCIDASGQDHQRLSWRVGCPEVGEADDPKGLYAPAGAGPPEPVS
jgi:hypothetical protein